MKNQPISVLPHVSFCSPGTDFRKKNNLSKIEKNRGPPAGFGPPFSAQNCVFLKSGWNKTEMLVF